MYPRRRRLTWVVRGIMHDRASHRRRCHAYCNVGRQRSPGRPALGSSGSGRARRVPPGRRRSPTRPPQAACRDGAMRDTGPYRQYTLTLRLDEASGASTRTAMRPPRRRPVSPRGAPWAARAVRPRVARPGRSAGNVPGGVSRHGPDRSSRSPTAPSCPGRQGGESRRPRRPQRARPSADAYPLGGVPAPARRGSRHAVARCRRRRGRDVGRSGSLRSMRGAGRAPRPTNHRDGISGPRSRTRPRCASAMRRSSSCPSAPTATARWRGESPHAAAPGCHRALRGRDDGAAARGRAGRARQRSGPPV